MALNSRWGQNLMCLAPNANRLESFRLDGEDNVYDSADI